MTMVLPNHGSYILRSVYFETERLRADTSTYVDGYGTS